MTLADFKRMAVVGNEMRGGYFWKLESKGLTLDQCEWRKITSVQTNGVRLNGSFLDFPKANACEFDGKTLKIFETGYRELTNEEKSVMAEWKKITETNDYQKQLEYDLLTDCSITYYQEKRFFEEHNMLYLFQHTPSKSLDDNRYKQGDKFCVRDNKAPHGKQIAEYEIRVGK